MTSASDPFADLPLEERIRARAARNAIDLSASVVSALARHARAVLAANERLHLTTITDPEEFIERHLGEAFEGAALLPEGVAGTLLDVGSGNGYPVLPVVAARPALRALLVEASQKKSSFLERGVNAWGLPFEVLFQQVQRAADLVGKEPASVLTMRGVGGWTRLVPKLAPALAADGVILLWAGSEVESVRHRVAWRRLELVREHPLPERERTAIWVFRHSS